MRLSTERQALPVCKSCLVEIQDVGVPGQKNAQSLCFCAVSESKSIFSKMNENPYIQTVVQFLKKILPAFASSFSFSIFFYRRRREKLQAHLKESRTLKNYTANSHNALDGKMRAPNANLQMHEVIAATSLF